MEETYNVKAIIINRKSFSEDDSRAVVYSQELGKLDLIARGAKKIKSKLAGHLEPISLAELMVVRGRQYNYVGAAVSKKCYINIKNDLDKLVSVGRIFKIVDKQIKPGVEDKEIFNLLEDYLDIADSNKADINIFSSFFILKFLARLGFSPQLSFCVNCGSEIKPGNNRFDLTRSGIICHKCSNGKILEQIDISDDSIKLLRLVLKFNFNRLLKVKIDKKIAKEISRVIVLFFDYNF
jgi:DNA repair protein RecO (recombination protein O)